MHRFKLSRLIINVTQTVGSINLIRNTRFITHEVYR
jgi:hypothetical protein